MEYAELKIYGYKIYYNTLGKVQSSEATVNPD